MAGKYDKLLDEYREKDEGVQSGDALQPISGTGSPEGTETSRYRGDIYIDTDTATNTYYYNPNNSGNTGWIKLVDETLAIAYAVAL